MSDVKYVIVIPDGAADEPQKELADRTPLEAAHTPAMDALAAIGRVGTACTTPKAMPCGSDVCSMSLLGYDPRVYHTGRAPLEAAALGIELAPTDWIFRVNLVTVLDGVMRDHSAGHIRDAEARQLLADLAGQLHLPAMQLYPGVSYRNIMVDISGRVPGITPRDWEELKTIAPHDIPGEAIEASLPVGSPHDRLLREMIHDSAALLAEHEINLTRREMGELPATHLWPWGQGRRPSMPAFEERFGLRGAMITAVDLLAGIAHFIGWDRLDVPGQSSYHDNDYVATGAHAIAALDSHDLICVHVESPDEASHAADLTTKIAAIEAIDRDVVGPIHTALRDRGTPWRMLVIPDHHTLLRNRRHDPAPVPFVMAGHHVHNVAPRHFGERAAAAADLHIDFGHELMEYFLFAGT